ncbi:RDD family protein, partial [Clostridium saudiense]|nr:RDD family protein [Clostridium saudiense]
IYSIVSGKTEIPTSLTLMKEEIGIGVGIIGIIIVSLYYIAIPLKKNKGQTLGKRILGIKIVQDDGSDVDIKSLLKREILGVALIEGGIVASSKYFREILLIMGLSKTYEILMVLAMVIPFISIAIMIFSKNSKMIHDFIGGTKVVEVMEEK